MDDTIDVDNINRRINEALETILAPLSPPDQAILMIANGIGSAGAALHGLPPEDRIRHLRTIVEVLQVAADDCRMGVRIALDIAY